jgi:putative endonuclease
LSTTKQSGDEGEKCALHHLQQQGLTLVERNYRVAHGRWAPAGEIDLIMQSRDGTLIFVEVRTRQHMGFGGAAASVNRNKQQRLIRTAQHYLMRYRSPPPCRFDVLSCEAGKMQWIQAAFDTSLCYPM